MFAAADVCKGVEFACITDRPCGAEAECARRGFAHRRIVSGSDTDFSAEAAAVLETWGAPDAALMLFARVVTPPLVGRAPLLNIHPSLLPAFPGMGAVAAAARAGASEFGATLLGVTMEVDGGPIVAQVRSPLPAGATLEHLERRSFLHKTELFLLAIDLLQRGVLRFAEGLPVLGEPNPVLRDERYRAHLRALEREIEVAAP